VVTEKGIPKKLRITKTGRTLIKIYQRTQVSAGDFQNKLKLFRSGVLTYPTDELSLDQYIEGLYKDGYLEEAKEKVTKEDIDKLFKGGNKNVQS